MAEDTRPVGRGLGGAVNTTLLTALSGVAIDLANQHLNTGVHPGWAVGAGAVTAAAAVVRARMGDPRMSWLSAGYRATCWAAVGGWIANATADTPYSVASAVTLAGGGLLAGLLSPVLSHREAKLEDERRHRLTITVGQKLIREWDIRLAKICRLRGHRVMRIEPWPNGFGYTVVVDIQATGMEWRQLRNYQGRLATNTDLPHGCGVEVERGESRGQVQFRVTTLDAYGGMDGIPYPLDDLMTVRSIADPLTIGWHRNADPAVASAHRQRWMLVAPPDQGKSNQLHTVTAGVLRTSDALVRIIDLNGGGLAWPWLRTWFDGRATGPAIDWVGPDPEEAAQLAADTLWEAKRRKREYQHLLVDDDKLPPGDGRDGNPPPAIVLIVDEGAEVGGAAATPAARAAAKDIQELIRIGRSVGITVIQCYLRATIDMSGATANKRLSGTRVLMRVQDAVEGQHLFGHQVDPEDAPFPGCGWLAEFGETPRAFRGFRTVGSVIDSVAIATASRRPVVHASPKYAGRWERIALPGSSQAPAARPGPSVTAGGGSKLDQIRAGRDRVHDAANRERAQRGEPLRHDPELAAEFDAVVKGMALVSGPDRMVQIVEAAGVTGIRAMVLLAQLQGERYEVSKATLYRWKDAADEVTDRDGVFVHRDHV